MSQTREKYCSLTEKIRFIRQTNMPTMSQKEYNYGIRASWSVSRLIKFLVNNIHIYDSKSIYYENTFYN
jgi:hypothetical protein